MSSESRRRFLQCFLILSGTAGPLLRRLTAEQPFDALPASVWNNAVQNGLAMIHRPAPSDLSWDARLAPPGEPGEPLVVAGRVFAPDGRYPAPDVTVYAYNTDAQGYYGAHHKFYPPRLYGWMKTDGAGRFELKTIRPGHYPDMHVPAHVHFVIWGGGYPLQWVDELRFAGDSYLTPELIAEDARKGDFRTIQPLTRDTAGVWHCRINIRAARETNFH